MKFRHASLMDNLIDLSNKRIERSCSGKDDKCFYLQCTVHTGIPLHNGSSRQEWGVGLYEALAWKSDLFLMLSMSEKP